MQTLLIIVAALLANSFIAPAFGDSETPFPSDAKNWQAVQTPLAKIGALPGCDADVSALPPIYQETVATYCSVKQGGPGAVEILVKPAVMKLYKERSGGYPDGSNLILHLKDMNVYFVSGIKSGKPVYGVYSTDGKDLAPADSSHPLATNTCRVCHSGYESYCVEGQCGISSE